MSRIMIHLLTLLTPGQNAPLRRGDACLMCRAKKLVRWPPVTRFRGSCQKCSASKPSCDQCSKRNDRCVYDAARPASRVEKLEQRLAEMEEEGKNNMATTRSSSDTSTPQTTPFLPPVTPQAPPMMNQSVRSSFDFGLMPFQPPPYFARQNQQPALNVMAMSRPHSLPDTSLAGLNSWQWQASSSSSIPHSFAPLPSTPFQPLPWNFTSTSHMPMPTQLFSLPSTPEDDPDQASSVASQPALTPGVNLVDPFATLMPSSTYSAPPHLPTTSSRIPIPTPAHPSPTILNTIPDLESTCIKEESTDPYLPPLYPSTTIPSHGLGLGGLDLGNYGLGIGFSTFEEKDLSQATRDYLYVDPWLYLDPSDSVYSVC